MPISIGVDLGTTFCAVGWVDPATGLPKIVPNAEGRHITPSIIQFMDGAPVFGSEAEEAYKAGAPNCAVAFKRSMGSTAPYFVDGDRVYTALDLSALLLRHLKEGAEAAMGQRVDSAVITVPAYFCTREREATKLAAEQAGLNVRMIVNEPTAAAMAYGVQHWRENARILVYDLGGGTFDVTLAAMGKDGTLTTVATNGDHYLGGKDWDDCIEQLLLERLSEAADAALTEDATVLSILRGAREDCKKQLSQMRSATVTLDLPGYGRRALTVTRADFEARSADLIDRTLVLCDAVLDTVRLRWRDVTDVLLVGGSTRMPQVADRLTEKLGKKPITHVNPDEAVALGAAIMATKRDAEYKTLCVKLDKGVKRAAALDGGGRALDVVKAEKRLGGAAELKVNDIISHALGMIAVSTDMTHYVNDIIIPANHPIPVRAAKRFRFRTRARGENALEIYVLQGDKAPLQCEIANKYVVSGIRHIREQGGETLIRVQYSYDQNGIIHVEARQEDDETDLPIRREAVEADLSRFGRPIEQEAQTVAEPLTVVMAVDVSGSMSGAPLKEAKRAMCRFLDELDMDGCAVGVMVVSDRSEVLLEPTQDDRACRRAIESIREGQTGYCNAAHPFREILELLEGAPGRRYGVVLADGVWDRQDAAIAAAQACHAGGIDVIGIGFGSADRAFLAAISSTDENAFLVSQGELTQTFGKIAQSLGAPSRESVRRGSRGEDTVTWVGRFK